MESNKTQVNFYSNCASNVCYMFRPVLRQSSGILYYIFLYKIFVFLYLMIII
jgi:hypothetical protein